MLLTDPLTTRSVYPNCVLADGGIFAWDRWGVPTIVPPDHQWELPNSKHPRNYFVSNHELSKLKSSHEGRWKPGGWQRWLFRG